MRKARSYEQDLKVVLFIEVRSEIYDPPGARIESVFRRLEFKQQFVFQA